MPIFEFKCLKCEEYFEWLVMNDEEKIRMKCPECGAEDFERIMSTTNYSLADNSSKATTGTSAKTRTCSGGSCTTYDIPGPTR